MKTELLHSLKEEYKRRMDEQSENDKNLKVLLNRKRLLENSPIVKDYIELTESIDMLSAEMESEEDILRDIISKSNDLLSENSYSIYYYAGSYLNEGLSSIRVERNSSIAEYNVYIDLESRQTIEVPVEDSRLFEENNLVIVLNNENTNYNTFNVIREMFLSDSIKHDLNIASQKVLKLDKKNF